MNDAPDRRPARGFWAVLLLWAAAFAYSLWIYRTTMPAGDGFTRGLNRVTGFLGWQAVAGVLALAVFALGRRLPAGDPLRRVSVIPLAFALLLLAGIAGLVLWARFAHP